MILENGLENDTHKEDLTFLTKEAMMEGKRNIAAGFLFMAAFMVFGFILIYLRDFAPGKESWIANYATGKHFESRLAHVHGNLFRVSQYRDGVPAH